MRFMLLQNYEPAEHCDVPMTEWAPADVHAHIEFQHLLNVELEKSGEFVAGEGLAGPEEARIVTWEGGEAAPVITDGPFPEMKELLAGYRIVDVDGPERAAEIAARASAAPGPGGRPMGIRIHVRQILGPPTTDA